MTRKSAGFTLIELIVAMGVASVIGLLAISIALGVVDVWNRSGDKVRSDAEVQYALDIIARDLESAFFRERGETMFAVTALHSTDVANSGRWVTAKSLTRPTSPKPFDPANDQYGWAGCWLRFFTAAPGLNAVGYQLIRTPVVGSSSDVRYNLFRGVVRMDHTVTEGFDIDDPTSKYAIAGTPILGNPVEVISPRLENIVLSNVIDFGIRLYVYDEVSASEGDDSPPGLRIIFPADNSNNLDDTDSAHLASTSIGTDITKIYPEAAEVIIRVINETGWRLLRELEANGGTANEWQRIVDQHSTVYRRFVDIRGKVFSG